MHQQKKHTLRNTLTVLVGFITLFNLCFQLYRIPTTSMVPTLMPGDYIFVNKLAYGVPLPFTRLRILKLREPRRGEVAVFFPPHERKKAFVKRVIGQNGETLAIEGGNVYIDGKEVVEPVIARNYYYNQGTYGLTPEGIRIPENAYFFLGDNSISSADSRIWGFVKEDDIIGKAVFIWWPPARINMVE